MKRVVLGTAGHIDHGKTALTKALTGVDTDRLAEEKARGITIEPGFAALKLSSGAEISLIDVPGHERFVRNMMTGVSGIDGALLVVAADDGVMPQTREHFDILKLLGIARGIVVLTKADLADDERLDEVRAEVAALVEGSFLECAPVCAVSALTGEGIDALRGEIERLVDGAGERNDARPFRLSVDRAFQLPGFGTVAAGTVTEGRVRVGDTVELLPSGARGTVRTLQTRGAQEDEAGAGTRVAMSFSGMEVRAERGFVVAEPGSTVVTDSLTAFIEILPDCPYAVKNASQLHLFHGTDEQVCKLRLLDSDELKAGGRGYAQLKLARPLSVRMGDRFLLRFFSPVLTIGGGTILAAGDGRLKRNNEAVLDRLERLGSADAGERLLRRAEDGGLSPVAREDLRRHFNLSPDEYRPVEEALLATGRAIELRSGELLAANIVDRKLDGLRAELERYHAAYPLAPGMRIAAWRGKLFPEGGAPAEALLRYWAARGDLRYESGFLSLSDFAPVFTQEHKIMQRRLLHHYREAWFRAPDLRDVREKFERFGELFEQTLDNMRMVGLLIPLDRRYWVHNEAEKDAFRIFESLAENGGGVTLAQLRTAADISRKYSQLFLEYWDAEGLTRRVGDAHVPTGKRRD